MEIRSLGILINRKDLNRYYNTRVKITEKTKRKKKENQPLVLHITIVHLISYHFRTKTV